MSKMIYDVAPYPAFSEFGFSAPLVQVGLLAAVIAGVLLLLMHTGKKRQ